MVRLKSRGSLLNGAGKPYSLCLVCTAAIDERTSDGEAPSINNCMAHACTISLVAGMIDCRSRCAKPYVTKPRHRS
jgi:hypothetical protein